MMNVYLWVVDQTSWDSFPEPRAICPAHIPSPRGVTGNEVSIDDSCPGDLPPQISSSQALRRKDRHNCRVHDGPDNMEVKRLVECVDWQAEKLHVSLSKRVWVWMDN